MGASLGGMIVKTVAIEHPDRALSLISVSSTSGDHALPDAQIESVEGLGHIVSDDAAVEIASLVAAFVNDLHNSNKE